MTRRIPSVEWIIQAYAEREVYGVTGSIEPVGYAKTMASARPPCDEDRAHTLVIRTLPKFGREAERSAVSRHMTDCVRLCRPLGSFTLWPQPLRNEAPIIWARWKSELAIAAESASWSDEFA